MHSVCGCGCAELYTRLCRSPYLVQTASVSTNASLDATPTTRVCSQTRQLVTHGQCLIHCCCYCRRRHGHDARADAGDAAGRGNGRRSFRYARHRLLRGQPASDPVPWRIRHHGKRECPLTISVFKRVFVLSAPRQPCMLESVLLHPSSSVSVVCAQMCAWCLLVSAVRCASGPGTTVCRACWASLLTLATSLSRHCLCRRIQRVCLHNLT